MSYMDPRILVRFPARHEFGFCVKKKKVIYLVEKAKTPVLSLGVGTERNVMEYVFKN